MYGTKNVNFETNCSFDWNMSIPQVWVTRYHIMYFSFRNITLEGIHSSDDACINFFGCTPKCSARKLVSTAWVWCAEKSPPRQQSEDFRTNSINEFFVVSDSLLSHSASFVTAPSIVFKILSLDQNWCEDAIFFLNLSDFDVCQFAPSSPISKWTQSWGLPTRTAPRKAIPIFCRWHGDTELQTQSKEAGVALSSLCLSAATQGKVHLLGVSFHHDERKIPCGFVNNP